MKQTSDHTDLNWLPNYFSSHSLLQLTEEGNAGKIKYKENRNKSACLSHQLRCLTATQKQLFEEKIWNNLHFLLVSKRRNFADDMFKVLV